MKDFLPFALPSIGAAEIDEVCDSLRSGWLTSGPKTRKFEYQFADFVGSKEAIAVNSGTAGLHLALEAIGVGAGDKVITSTYTFTATAEVVRYLGADPILVDIDRDTQNMSVKEVAKILMERDDVKAILPVHFAGQACDMDELSTLANQHNVKLIEDAAHALPTTYQGRMIGTIGDITAFSFYVTKTLSTGEGGMITTDDDSLADRMRVMRLHGISSDVFDRYSSTRPSWYYEVVAPGYKYNMPDLAAAIGLHQLERVQEFWNRRNDIASQYNEAFQQMPIVVPRNIRPTDIHAWHLYVIQLMLEELKINRDHFIEEMSNQGIGTSVHFIPLHLHPYWRDRYDLREESFPVAQDIYRRVISLPIYPRMDDKNVNRVIETVHHICKKYSR